MKALVLGLVATTSAAVGWTLWARSAPAIAAVHPATGDLPANFLRVYVDFTEPMGGDDAFEHVRLLDAQGRPIPAAFRELELWSRNRTRLMAYVHPGRVKTGLAMGDEFGPVLEEGKRYTLEITPGMKSLGGRRVAGTFRRELRIGPPVSTRPDVDQWRLEGIPGGLVITCDRWMDHAALEDWMRVEGHPGRWSVDGRRITFLPEKPLPTGRHILTVDARMEDICGNSFQRTFETRPDSDRPPQENVGRDFWVP